MKFFSALFLFFIPAAPLQDLGSVGNFSLQDQNSKAFTEQDLAGHPWVVDFIFTRCSGPCLMLSRTMSRLQKVLPKEIRLLSISVDPEYDSPKALSEYAARQGADPSRWFFLTGPKDKVYEVIRSRFLNPVEKNPDAKDAGEAFIHSQRLILLDGNGRIRGFYDGEDPAAVKQIMRDMRLLSPWGALPSINAHLNLACAFFLIAGYFFIRLKRVTAHKISMGLAFSTSILFLVSYLYYHWHAGSMPFQDQGWIRTLYFSILISHTILAAVILPLSILTLLPALKGNFEAHKNLARWTLPVWLYVSVTGVAVYVMLYRL